MSLISSNPCTGRVYSNLRSHAAPRDREVTVHASIYPQFEEFPDFEEVPVWGYNPV